MSLAIAAERLTLLLRDARAAWSRELLVDDRYPWRAS